MSYTVVVAFDAVDRTYAKGTVQTFGEWPDDDRDLLIKHYEKLGWIVSDMVEAKPIETVAEATPQPEAPHAE